MTNTLSASPCGCDPGIDYICQQHTEWPIGGQTPLDIAGAIWSGEDVAPIPLHGPDGYSERATFTTPVGKRAGTPSVEYQLRKEYPNGHPNFLDITMREIRLHDDKSHDYASGGDPLGNFKRVAAILAQYPDLDMADPRVVALVYTMKQLDAVLWGLNSQITQKVEGLASRLQDISVYAKIVACLCEDMA